MIRLSTGAFDFDARFGALLTSRDTNARDMRARVEGILEEVETAGDRALLALTERFDAWQPANAAHLRIPPDAVAEAARGIDPALRDAIHLAASRIEAFHEALMPADVQMHDDSGVTAGLRWTPLDSAGIYVPGGKAAYPSSVLMNAVPARVAGVARIAMCVPCPGGVPAPAVLAAAARAGVEEIYAVGGAQAVAALAFGTETIPAVDRIVGPGNAYVAEAKRQVSGRVGIDGIAGPSEVVVLADAGHAPAEVAADLLAQAEHDEDAQAVLITDNAAWADRVEEAVSVMLGRMARAEIARRSWERHGAIVVVRDWSEVPALVDRLAPEHLQIMTADPRAMFSRIRHAGAVFLGRYAPEALGDYVAGPNHVLPTGRTARFASGLSVFDFLKRTTYVEAGAGAFVRLAPAAAVLADAEGLSAHAESLRLRLPHARRA